MTTPRTTAAEVESIIEVDATISLTPFITIANELVTEYCADEDYTEARLALIETWLAAHFYAVRDLRVASESAGVSVSYYGSVGQNLSGTMYGQQAMVLDTAGGLASLNKQVGTGKKSSVSCTWLGT